MNSAPIGIIGAMASEVVLLKEKMTNIKTEKFAGIEFFCGELDGVNVVVEQCGIGKVCAAMGTQAMIDHFGIRCLIKTGVAGGLKKGLKIGDMVISCDVIQHDYDLTAFGYAKGYLAGIGVGDSSKPTRISADSGLVDTFKKIAPTILPADGWTEGTIVSGDIFVHSNELKQTLIDVFGAAAAEMEGAAIGEVAYLNGVPFIVIRAISDLADNSATVSYDEFEKQAARFSAQVVIAMCKAI